MSLFNLASSLIAFPAMCIALKSLLINVILEFALYVIMVHAIVVYMGFAVFC
jgi:hypothetical protein